MLLIESREDSEHRLSLTSTMLEGTDNKYRAKRAEYRSLLSARGRDGGSAER